MLAYLIKINRNIIRLVSCAVLITFFASQVMAQPFGIARGKPYTNLVGSDFRTYEVRDGLPSVGTMIRPTLAFDPAMIKGVTVFPDNPLRFDFIVDTGDTDLEGEPLKAESNKLIKYFLTALTVPEEDLWVNLSPNEPDRIIPEKFGQTEMGRDLLAQDYILKQLTASLMYPEDELGEEFWDRVHAKAHEEYGLTDIPVDTFNKVWIVPEKAVVYENAKNNTAFVVESRLKVMLEEDYVAIGHRRRGLIHQTQDKGMINHAPTNSNITTSIIRKIIIPAIEQEVNEGQNFTQLRQIYHSLILATWFKRNLKESVLGKIYVGQNKTDGVDIEDKQAKEKIYHQYLESFKQGAYDYIKEDYDPATKEIVPRKYFSGGTDLAMSMFSADGEENRVKERFSENGSRFVVKANLKSDFDKSMTMNKKTTGKLVGLLMIWRNIFRSEGFLGYEGFFDVEVNDKNIIVNYIQEGKRIKLAYLNYDLTKNSGEEMNYLLIGSQGTDEDYQRKGLMALLYNFLLKEILPKKATEIFTNEIAGVGKVLLRSLNKLGIIFTNEAAIGLGYAVARNGGIKDEVLFESIQKRALDQKVGEIEDEAMMVRGLKSVLLGMKHNTPKWIFSLDKEMKNINLEKDIKEKGKMLKVNIEEVKKKLEESEENILSNTEQWYFDDIYDFLKNKNKLKKITQKQVAWAKTILFLIKERIIFRVYLVQVDPLKEKLLEKYKNKKMVNGVLQDSLKQISINVAEKIKIKKDVSKRELNEKFLVDLILEGIQKEDHSMLEADFDFTIRHQNNKNIAKGGIDLNASTLPLDVQGGGVNFNLSMPTELCIDDDNDGACERINIEALENSPITGFTPVIFQIVPLTNLNGLLGIADDDSSDDPQDLTFLNYDHKTYFREEREGLSLLS